MTLTDFTELEDKLAVRRTAMLFITLWMTWRAFEWAATYAMIVKSGDGLAAAAMIAAVTAPITYLQTAVFKSYIEAKS